MEQTLLRMEGICKSFGGIHALRNVDFGIKQGEVLGLVGENGAGKSTLMKIMCGIVPADSGRILLEDRVISLASPADAQRQGIAMIPQELLLVRELTVVQNLFLGQETLRGPGLLDKKKMKAATERILAELHSSHINPLTPAGNLPKADQQIVAIARRLLRKGRVFVMDEPTTALTEKETETLFRIIRQINRSGCSTVYISHRLEEVIEICDRVTILRDGEVVQQVHNGGALNKETLIYHMVGSHVGDEFPHTEVQRGSEVLRGERLAFRTYQGSLVRDVSFAVHESEVVGVTGLAGVGKTELAQSIMGLRKLHGGRLYIQQKPALIRSPVDAVRHHIGYVTEDRRDEGLVLGLESQYNMTLSSLRQVSTAGVISAAREDRLAKSYMGRLGMSEQQARMEAQQLSGGNQQKVVILRQIISDARIVIFDEPTKGIDVGAKSEVSRIIGEMSRNRKAILIFSSEPREVLGISDIIYVLTSTGMRGPYSRGALTHSRLMAIEFGQNPGQ